MIQFGKHKNKLRKKLHENIQNGQHRLSLGVGYYIKKYTLFSKFSSISIYYYTYRITKILSHF